MDRDGPPPLFVGLNGLDRHAQQRRQGLLSLAEPLPRVAELPCIHRRPLADPAGGSMAWRPIAWRPIACRSSPAAAETIISRAQVYRPIRLAPATNAPRPARDIRAQGRPARSLLRRPRHRRSLEGSTSAAARTSGYSREKYGLSGKIVCTRVVLPDWRGPRIVTTGYSAAQSTSAFVTSRAIMCSCALRLWKSQVEPWICTGSRPPHWDYWHFRDTSSRASPTRQRRSRARWPAWSGTGADSWRSFAISWQNRLRLRLRPRHTLAH